MRNTSDKGRSESHFPRFIFKYYFPEIRTVYDKMWKNNVERGRILMTVWCMRIACGIPKVTNTQSEYVTITALHAATMVTRTRLHVTL